MAIGSKGRALETTVIASQMGRIRVRKMEAGSKWLRGSRVIQTLGPVDFVGTVVGTGRSICFDTKQCAIAGRFPIRGQLAPHQRDYLIEQGQAGAIAGLLIESTSLRRFYWLSWEHLVRDEASVPWDDLRLVELGPTTHLIRFDRVPGIVPIHTPVNSTEGRN